jgi:hypothetical protein
MRTSGLLLPRPATLDAVRARGTGLCWRYDASTAAAQLAHPRPRAESAGEEPTQLVVDIECRPAQRSTGTIDLDFADVSRGGSAQALDEMGREGKQ